MANSNPIPPVNPNVPPPMVPVPPQYRSNTNVTDRDLTNFDDTKAWLKDKQNRKKLAVIGLVLLAAYLLLR